MKERRLAISAVIAFGITVISTVVFALAQEGLSMGFAWMLASGIIATMSAITYVVCLWMVGERK